MEFERPAPDFSVRIDADESEIVFEALQDLWLLSAEAPLPTQNPYRDAGTQHFHERVFRTIEQTRVIAVAKLKQREEFRRSIAGACALLIGFEQLEEN